MEHRSAEERPLEPSSLQEHTRRPEENSKQNPPDYPRIHIKSFDVSKDTPNSEMPEYTAFSQSDAQVNETHPCSSSPVYHALSTEDEKPVIDKVEEPSQNHSGERPQSDIPAEKQWNTGMKRRGRPPRPRNASPQPPNKASNEAGDVTRVKRKKIGSSAGQEAAENTSTKRLPSNPSPTKQRDIAPSNGGSTRGMEAENTSDIVLCACGNMVDFGPMIQCSRCKGWSHKFCTGLSDAEWEQLQLQNARYQCWICAPRSTKLGSIAADAAQALASIRTGAKWNTIMGRIIESAAMENAELVGMPPTKPRKGRMVESVGTGSSLPRTHRSTGPRVATTEGAAPLVRDNTKESAFFEALAAHWERKTGQSWQTPMFRGKLLDLYALYWGVKARGGIDAVIAAKRWPEIWRTMRNYYRESTDHSFRLRIASQQYLADFLKQFPGSQPWDVESLKVADDIDTKSGEIEKHGGTGSGIYGARNERSRRERIHTTQELVKPELAVPGYVPTNVKMPANSASRPRTSSHERPQTAMPLDAEQRRNAVEQTAHQSDDEDLGFG